LCKVHPKGQMLHPTVTLPIQVALYLALLSSSIAVKAFGGWPYWVTLPLACIALAGLLSAFALYDEGHKKQVIAILGDKRFDQIYRRLTLPIFVWFWRRVCNPVARGAGLLATLQAALTARLYDRAMLIAVLYPILLPTLVWLAFGKAGQLGTFTFLPETTPWDFWPERLAVGAHFAIMTAGVIAHNQALVSRKLQLLGFEHWSFLARTAFGFVLVFALVGDATGAFVFAVTVAITVAKVFNLGGATRGSIALLSLGAVAVVGAGQRIGLGWGAEIVNGDFAASLAILLALMLLYYPLENSKRSFGLAALTVGLPIGWLGMAFSQNWAAAAPEMAGKHYFYLSWRFSACQRAV
jgi:hypothetical protein